MEISDNKKEKCVSIHAIYVNSREAEEWNLKNEIKVKLPAEAMKPVF